MFIGDSAYPPAAYPTSFGGKPIVGWCVYIGGDTPHPWTSAEIEHLKALPWCRYIVPIFTRSNPVGADAAADAAVAIAWAKTYGQPSGTLTEVDYETARDSAYELAFAAALRAGDGDLELLYGSKADVVKNSRPDGGYDEADWTGADYAPADTADQFASFAAYDLNDFTPVAPLWDLRPTPVAPPATPTDLEETEMLLIRQGGTTAAVYLLYGGRIGGIADHVSYDGYVAAGVKEADVSEKELARLLALYGPSA
jgi:hypothetical protein